MLLEATWCQPTPIQELVGVGARVAQSLAKLNIFTIEDLLLHVPTRYQDRSRVTPIQQIVPNSHVVVAGHIENARIAYGRRRSLCCELVDTTGRLTLRFFHFNNAQLASLSTPNVKWSCFGVVRFTPQTGLSMIHPEFRRIADSEAINLDPHLTPVYVSQPGITQTLLRKLIAQALQWLAQQNNFDEWLDSTMLQKNNLMPLKDALQYLHQPPLNADTELLANKNHPAYRRLIFEELVAHYLALHQPYQHDSLRAPALPTPVENDWQAQLLAELPFQLTASQQRVIAEINQDLLQTTPMRRLVQGDVGSGKTLVALNAILRALQYGYQATLMVPTEILAEQHFQTISKLLEKWNIRIGLLTSSLTGKNREAFVQQINSGECQLVIGTHALIQEKVKFAKLGLLVIDEQHRFGVSQRLLLQQKNSWHDLYPHQLIMTATPIPRTLAMTAYADLNLSVINELPAGRQPITTVLVGNSRRDEVIGRVRELCKEGGQAYWVCTLIEESEELQAQAAEAAFAILQKNLPELNIGLVHGRLKAAEKEQVMQHFKKGVFNLIVATTVIEVGVDVPAANLMVIENAERLGLAQLHQLRGRVGRGRVSSFCVLMYQTPLSKLARERLSILRDHQDGFVIAEADLRIRGPGDVLGTKQAGFWELKIADAQRDAELLSSAQRFSQQLMGQVSLLAKSHLLARWSLDRLDYRRA